MFLGLDLGTSGVKAAVINENGSILAKSYKGLKMHGLESGKRELCPQEVIAAIQEVIQNVIKICGQDAIEIITVSSLGEAAIPIDKHGNILMNSILGSDCRGSESLKKIKQAIDEKEIVDITGLNLSTIYTLNKIIYLKEEHPSVFEKTEKFLCFEDFAIWWLTGEAYTDFSMASRTLAFDINKQDWSERILSSFGFNSSIFSKPVLAGTIVGHVQKNVAEALGLRENVKVAVGTHDHICNAIGAGAVKKGICSNSCGTTEGITTVIGNEKMQTKDIITNNISCEPFAQLNMFNTVAWHNTAGALINWFVKLFYDEPQDMGELLKKLDASCSKEPTKLMGHPHFSGATAKNMDEFSKGSVFGLSLSTTKNDLFKALMEGSTYELLLIMTALEESSIRVDNLVCSGGESKSDVWLQIKADILDIPVNTVQCSDTGAVGAGILSAVACGYYKDIQEGACCMVKKGKTFEPIMKNNTIYSERFREYKDLYNKTKDISHVLT